MDVQLHEKKGLRIAVEGCGHGTLNAIYSAVAKSCEVNQWDGVDLLIIGGDFQAVRNAQDLHCMSVPVRYREIGDFHEYYSGARVAPYLTLFVGGNHEASNHLWELYYGGWAAPNIYYLGAANVLRLGPLRIAGLSGIWKGYNYNKSHYERLPYNQDDVKSIYHVRELDVRKLLLLRTQVDIGISHDWPRGVEWSGDHRTLFRKKDLFEADSRAGNLGSAAAKYVLDRLRPAYWFSAHLHVKFPAIVQHPPAALQQPGPDIPSAHPDPAPALVSTNGVKNSEEIDLDIDMDDEADGHPASAPPLPTESSKADPAVPMESPSLESLRAQLPVSFSRPAPAPSRPVPAIPRGITNLTTEFLALDKCLPGRKFLQILEVEPISKVAASASPHEASTPLRLEYDPEWLAIVRALASDLCLGDRHAPRVPDLGEAHYQARIEQEAAWVEEHIVSPGRLVVPTNFEITAPTFDPTLGFSDIPMPPEYDSPQTAAFCALLEIKNHFFATAEEKAERLRLGPEPAAPRFGGHSHRGGPGWGRGRGLHGGRGRGRGRGRGAR